MIELKLIPDVPGTVPFESKDDSLMATYLSGASNIPDDANAPISGWREIRRVVPGHGEYVALRVPGEPTDYPGSTLDAIANAITNNIGGLKPHAEGWQYVGQG